tara:strand:- start:433 stop:630 length:198 start_codon:yes stop_codon:yes gene_type:complete
MKRFSRQYTAEYNLSIDDSDEGLDYISDTLMTGLPDNIDYGNNIENTWFESDFEFSSCILDVHKF